MTFIPNRVPLQRSIATKLLLAVFSVYLVITIVLTAGHMFAEYYYTKKSVRQELIAFQQTFNPGLAAAIYNVDKEGISSMVLGMVLDPMVVGALVETEYQGQFKYGTIPAVGEGEQFLVRAPITYAEPGEDSYTIGVLTLYSSNAVVLNKVWFALAIILVNAVIKTVALWIIFLWFSRRYLVQPLATLTEATTKVRMQDIERHKVSLETPGRNELRVLAEAFNDMIDKLAASKAESEELHQSLAEAKNSLEEYNRTLEERVEVRTYELKKAKDAAEKATAFKSVFLANMSHEIRTPMNVVLGMADLLEEANVDKEQAELLQILRKAGGNLLRLIDDILDISKVEAGQVELESIPFDLVDLGDSVCKGHAVAAHAKGVEVVCRISPKVSEFVVGDPTRLRQVLGNLVSNAVKFTEAGEVVLSIERTAPDTYCFSVSDSGIGLSSEKLVSIFESFSQADSSTTRKYGGTGLGLAICKQLVLLMGGTIDVRSRLGHGAEFSFTIKLKQGQGDGWDRGAPALATKRILVADDNVQVRLFLSESLGAWGAEVLEASSGNEALSLWKEHAGGLDMIVMDQFLGDMLGLEVISKANGFPLPKLLLLTSSPLEEHERYILSDPNIAVLLKPLGAGELRERMRGL